MSPTLHEGTKDMRAEPRVLIPVRGNGSGISTQKENVKMHQSLVSSVVATEVRTDVCNTLLF